MSGTSFVRLEKADFQFCAAHFCVFSEGREPLHGHNYRVYVGLDGAMDELGFVAEFGWLKQIIRELVAKLDHRVLIAEQCPGLELKHVRGQLELRWGADSWSFPEADTLCLPVKNTTAEMLAGYIWDQIRDRLAALAGWNRLVVEVEETPGQRAGVSRNVEEQS